MTKSIGIYMDHASAHIIPSTGDPAETTLIESAFTASDKTLTFEHGEKAMHHSQQRDLSAYYKKIGEVIKQYEQVVLFGPTDAKKELLNLLKKDHHFDQISIRFEHTDKLTENQQLALVREHFKTIHVKG
jgi:stalled ribosome rescue protein Dom34